MFGFHSPQCGKHFTFKPVPTNKKFIQILHVEDSHWIAVSNIDVRQDTILRNQGCVYDSFNFGISNHTKKQIASLTKTIKREQQLDVMNVMLQPDTSSCGLFALAYAADLAHNIDPTLSQYDVGKMRLHLRMCLEGGHISPFPVTRN